MKFLFGITDVGDRIDSASEEHINYLHKLTSLLSSKIEADKYVADHDMQTALHQANQFEVYISNVLFFFLLNSVNY